MPRNTSAKGFLAYGMDLGVNFGFTGEDAPSWYRPEEPEFSAAVQLLRSAGLLGEEFDFEGLNAATTSIADWRAFRVRMREGMEKLGVRLLVYGDNTERGFFLAATVYETDSNELPLPLMTLAVPPGADDRLRANRLLLDARSHGTRHPAWHLVVTA